MSFETATPMPEEKIDLNKELQKGQEELKKFEAMQARLAGEAASDPEIKVALEKSQEALWETFVKGFGYSSQTHLEDLPPEDREKVESFKQGLWSTFKSGFGFRDKGPDM
ncbi:MAG TPA: hypothetical protein VMX18_02875 [Candidatus Bipolaricaulota bacterium]|nr:hypothetical protein [Candidatus Bipolaricaulota bacterium]